MDGHHLVQIIAVVQPLDKVDTRVGIEHALVFVGLVVTQQRQHQRHAQECQAASQHHAVWRLEQKRKPLWMAPSCSNYCISTTFGQSGYQGWDRTCTSVCGASCNTTKTTSTSRTGVSGCKSASCKNCSDSKNGSPYGWSPDPSTKPCGQGLHNMVHRSGIEHALVFVGRVVTQQLQHQ